MRKPIVAGQFYESELQNLKKQIKSCFLHCLGPGKLPVLGEQDLLGVIAPHAGYLYSGPAQAHAYTAIANSKKPDLYIILGLSHAGHSNCISIQDWETPFGSVKIDLDFANSLIEKGIKVNEAAHASEHSIEVQLPFLQFVKEDFKILPMIVSTDDIMAEKLVKTLDESGKKAVFICSSDFTHYGKSYGYVPFVENVKKSLYSLDRGAIDAIEKLDNSSFLNYLNKTNATICGKSPIMTFINICNMFKKKKAHLLKYYTSADIINDYSSAVGYASLSVN